ncbi:hypothetical protein G4H71_04095 [Rhodococcus triatomae]|uniref:Uncharacterized protein n=1 Tax=Rhodococcus triatomae TaxID=300028 RepID=A0A1G7ZL91_9NOCA|nr:hypothetical protein [Rhodococcus triatomae]QNG18011.1 hypothetical protein G4H72_03945 [Rhodococcus triatomae]QNG22320.1 hypothetical protein G4H71_04095 [Rhodococcus triatomae]SDH09385.1 hypothetical protein SAMN05444695_101145 [Rhodococcus triatomae]
MTLAVFFLLLAGALVVAGVALREREVPAEGVIGRGRRAHLVAGALAVSVTIGAVLTLDRLITLAG